ncbi:peptidyl-prolyl cis-trans isomerase [Alteromonas pelagimontana]|uniref:Peptidyl-prolyl cis-trans isomerase n=1 Tax=Alteromonas pelagimontana TaxID=1858656 RepID=A0A6M4MCS6_9ALTE|nr:peptidylprolyl isomerase [Alteromonas pelagimontana]QJR80365.1 peptidyl-prolyl cis-trans isomerase [Alteromonas pelagimontana]
MLRTLLLALVLITSTVTAKDKDDGSQIQPDNYYPRVKMETTMGDIVVELDRRRAPLTTNNFLRYVDKHGYDDTVFHRTVPGFVVQGGGYNTDLEEKPSYPEIFNESGNGMKNELYTIAMARQNEPHSATRQFFFNVNDNPSLDPGKNWGYAVFGMIVEGSEIVDKMMEVETEYQVALGEPNFPIEPIVLKKATILPPV